jgi:ABC-type glycerol-3-phosphate transport system substrate-binding protein
MYKITRRKLKKSGWLFLCFIFIGFGIAGCSKESIDNTIDGNSEEYAYVSDFLKLPASEGTNLTDFVVSDDSFYYLQEDYTDNNHQSPDYRLYRLPFNETEPKPMELQLPPNSNVLKMLLDNDNQLVIALKVTNEDESDSTFLLQKFDSDGNAIFTIDVSEQINKDPIFSYIVAMAIDRDGNYYLANNNTVWLYQASGQYLGMIETGDLISDMEIGEDGRVYVLHYIGNNQALTAIDFQTKSLAEAYDNFPEIIAADLILDAEGNFVVSDGYSLLSYDIEKQISTKILDWADSYITGTSVRQYFVLPDGRIVAINNIREGGYYHTEIAYLTKTPLSKIPEKEIIEASTLYHSYPLIQYAAEFNKQSDKYQIVVKTYINPESEMGIVYKPEDIAPLRQDIITNQASDIILLPMSSVDMGEYAAKGVFEDLNEWLVKSEDLSKEDIVDSITKAFTYEEQLIGLPISFTITTLVGKSAMVGNGSGWTIDDLSAYMDRYPDIQLLYNRNKNSLLRNLLPYQMDAFIDWEESTCQFDQEEFKDLLRLCNRAPKEAVSNQEPDGKGSWLLNNSYLLEKVEIYGVYELQLILDRVGEPVTFIGYPTKDGSSGNVIVPFDNSIYTMNAKSEHKEGAWEFLQYMFLRGDRYDESFPILRSKLNLQFQKAMEADSIVYEIPFTFSDGEVIDLDGATQDEIDALSEMIHGASITGAGAVEIMKIVDEESQAYFEGDKSLDEVAEIIQSRAQIYVDENN